MRRTTLAIGNASSGLYHMSSPLEGQQTRGQNGGMERRNLATPTDLSMVPSLGTWAERQRMPSERNETNHLRNHITMPERTRPINTEIRNRITSPTDSETTESSHEKLDFDQESNNPFWSETDLSTELTDLDDVSTEKHEEARKQFQSRLGKKKGITLASWNIRGKNDSAHNSKWPQIASIMRLQRITILAVQEARTTEEDAEQIEARVPKIRIITNGEYSSKMGVAFAITKDLIDENNLRHKIMIPNRASKLRVKWGDNQELTLINVYTPNDKQNKTKFFEKLASMTRNNKHKDLCVMGDFNCVEGDIDRSPTHKDNKRVVTSLRQITTRNKLVDVWRMQNPMNKAFSFFQTSSKAMAHIDRIYIHKDLFNYVYDNEVGMGQKMSDHNPVLVKIMAKNLPYCGKGLWRLPDEVIKNKKFRDISEKILRSFNKWMSEYTTKERLCDNMEEITVLRSDGQNPQTKWKKVKENIKETAIKITEEERIKANRLIKGLKRDMETQNKRTTSSNVTEKKTEKEPRRSSCSSKAP